jgi:hypothetical protein
MLADRIGGRHEHGCARAFAKRIEDPYWQENPCDCGAEADAEKVRALLHIVERLYAALLYWLPDETMVPEAHEKAWDEAVKASQSAAAALEEATDEAE